MRFIISGLLAVAHLPRLGVFLTYTEVSLSARVGAVDSVPVLGRRIDHNVNPLRRSGHQQQTPIVELNPHVAILEAVPQANDVSALDPLENRPPG